MIHRRPLALVTLCAASLPAQTTPAKPRIAPEAALPRYTYTVPGTAQQLVQAPDADFLTFARPVCTVRLQSSQSSE